MIVGTIRIHNCNSPNLCTLLFSSWASSTNRVPLREVVFERTTLFGGNYIHPQLDDDVGGEPIASRSLNG